MGRDWTPKEMWNADKHMLSSSGHSLRNVNFTIYDKTTNTSQALFTKEQIEVSKQFPDFAFLYDSFHNFFQKYAELESERDMLFTYIESVINLTANNKDLTTENILRQVEDNIAKHPNLLHENNIEYIKDKISSVIMKTMPLSTIEKWFNGQLSSSFYYNTENNITFGEAIDKTMCDIARDKCKEIAFGSTHPGQFHSDDVFATALLLKLNPEFKYERTREIPTDPSVFVYDKGMGKYDHHQADNEIRPNGIAFASFGKIWRDFSKYLMVDDRLMTKQERDVVERKIVYKIDASDNGQGHNDYSGFVALLNPINREEKATVEDADAMFATAVEFATTVLDRHIDLSVEIGKQYEILQDALETKQNGVVCLKQHISINEPGIHEMLDDNNIDLIVYPSDRGGYNVQQVTVSPEEYTGKLPFPQEWLGKLNDDLPEHITFCHSGNWLLAIDSETPQDAMTLACKIADTCREELKKDIGKESDDILP